MATEQINSEAIALTEKKVDMALDEIIKLSKSKTNKGRRQWRPSNRSQKFNGAKENALKVKQYIDSRSAVRQGAFAKRRSNFQGNQFFVTANGARKAAAAAPIRGRPFKAGWVANANKSRVGAPPVQRRAVNRGTFTAKAPQQQENKEQERNMAPRQRPQTLDSRFANMKEQRMRAFSQQKNNVRGNIAGSRVPWARGRFGN